MRANFYVAGTLALFSVAYCSGLNATDLVCQRIDSGPQVAIAAASGGGNSDDEGDDGVGDDQYTSVSASASGTGGSADVYSVASCPIAPTDLTGGPQCTSSMLVFLNSSTGGGASATSNNFGGSYSNAGGLFQVQGTPSTNGILKGIMTMESALNPDGAGTDPYETSFYLKSGSFEIVGWMDPENDYGWSIDVLGPEGYIITLNTGTSVALTFASEEMVTVGNSREVRTEFTNNRSVWNGTNTIENMSALSAFLVEETTLAVPASITVDDGEGPVTLWSSDW
jgi:hypothetical protein